MRANGLAHLLSGVSGINYRTETDKGDKSGLPVKKGSQVERGLGRFFTLIIVFSLYKYYTNYHYCHTNYLHET